MTIPRFDIFRIDKDGGLCWIGAADDVTEAQKLVTNSHLLVQGTSCCLI